MPFSGNFESLQPTCQGMVCGSIHRMTNFQLLSLPYSSHICDTCLRSNLYHQRTLQVSPLFSPHPRPLATLLTLHISFTKNVRDKEPSPKGRDELVLTISTGKYELIRHLIREHPPGGYGV